MQIVETPFFVSCDDKIEKMHAHNAKSHCLSRRCLPPCGLAGSRYYSLPLASNGSRYASAKLLRAKPDREGSSEKFLIKSVERS